MLKLRALQSPRPRPPITLLQQKPSLLNLQRHPEPQGQELEMGGLNLELPVLECLAPLVAMGRMVVKRQQDVLLPLP